MSDQEDKPVDAEVVDIDYIEPEGAPAALPAGEVQLDEQLALEPIKWEEQAVREHLKMLGELAHEAWGKSETDWAMAEKDLDRIGVPLTRILNNWEPTQRAAIISDPILLGYGTTMYATRSLLQRRAALLAEREAQEAAPDAAGYESTQPAAAAATVRAKSHRRRSDNWPVRPAKGAA